MIFLFKIENKLTNFKTKEKDLSLDFMIIFKSVSELKKIRFMGYLLLKI